LCEDLFTSQIPSVVCETVVRTLLVDEDLMVKSQLFIEGEQTRRDDVSPAFPDSNEEMRSASGTEGPFGPAGGIVSGDVFGTVELEVRAAIESKQWPTSPIAADVAMTGAYAFSYRPSDPNASAQARTGHFDICHLFSPLHP
jgi:hypothetical protein